MENTQTSTLSSILELGSKYLGIPMEVPNDDNDGSDAVGNAFDFADALYWHCVHNYNGMSSLEYWVRIQCKLEYKPSILANDVREDNSIIDIYGDDIMAGFIDANRNELLAIAGY